MKNIWLALGFILYILTWPMVYLYLRLNGERSRVVVSYDHKILLVRNWLSNGQWMLPGGGVQNHEQPTNSAVRELKEETGLIIKPSGLKLLGKINSHAHGLNLDLVCYSLRLKEEPNLKIRHWLEIAGLKWVDPKKGVAELNITPDTRNVIELWSKKVKL